jgi:hypothetical protein
MAKKSERMNEEKHNDILCSHEEYEHKGGKADPES